MRSSKLQVGVLAALLAIIVALASIAVSQSFTQKPFVGNAISQEEDSHEADYKITIEKKEGFWSALIGDPTAFFTAALAVVTTLLAGFTYNLLIVTRNGVVEDQRPWLSVKVSIRGPLEGGNILRCTVVADVTNVGKSTARNVYLHAEMFGGPAFHEAERWFFDLVKDRTELENGRSDVGSFLAPTETEQLALGIGVETKEIGFIAGNGGRKYIAPYIAIILTYRGMDGRRTCRYTARNYSVIEIRPEHAMPFIIDPERLPVKNVFLSAYAKHARAT